MVKCNKNFDLQLKEKLQLKDLQLTLNNISIHFVTDNEKIASLLIKNGATVDALDFEGKHFSVLSNQ